MKPYRIHLIFCLFAVIGLSEKAWPQNATTQCVTDGMKQGLGELPPPRPYAPVEFTAPTRAWIEHGVVIRPPNQFERASSQGEFYALCAEQGVPIRPSSLGGIDPAQDLRIVRAVWSTTEDFAEDFGRNLGFAPTEENYARVRGILTNFRQRNGSFGGREHPLQAKLLAELADAGFPAFRAPAPDDEVERMIWESFLPSWVHALDPLAELDRSHARYGTTRTHVDKFREKYGFPPTRENFNRLEKIAEGFGTFRERPRVWRFRPYESIADFPEFPPELPREYADAYRGIHSLWNDPAALTSGMDEIRKRVRARMATGQTEDQAIEAIRLEFEAKHGFGKPLDIQRILTTEEWDRLVKGGNPTRDVEGSHSFAGNAGFGQNAHRNQWLLIMLEMERNPARFGGQAPLAGNLYKKLADASWFGKMNFPPDPDIQTDVFNTQNPWYRLFDYVTRDSGVANAANPFYFNELWWKATGLSPKN
ncbi:MAG: hypothetical protein AB7P04_08235 [Bacteriovoracia bacterium]